MRRAKVYLDNHATTPLDDRVLHAMMPFFKDDFGNPSSRFHSYGWIANDAVEQARKTIAAAINAEPDEIIFTSGSTESNNTALRGVALANRSRGHHVITCATEHKSVLEVCESLKRDGYSVTYLSVDGEGMIELDELRDAITESTILISLMMVNNEIGVIHPIDEIGKIAREHNVLFHTDATQAVGKIDIDVRRQCIDLLSISGHKIYGPKGVGMLYLRRKDPAVKLKPLIVGGGQEYNLRSGTHNVAGIIGLAKAVELCEELRPSEMKRITELRNMLWDGLRNNLDDISLNGSYEKRIPNNLNISFHGVEAQALLMMVDDIALSLGSACLGQSIEPSYVLRALHTPEERMFSAVRFGLGRFTTKEEIEYTVERITETVQMLRENKAQHKTPRKVTPLN